MSDIEAPTPDRPKSVLAELLDVRQVASMVNASPRTVMRFSDAGRMPRPVKLGSLVRWRRADIEAWIAAGCPAVRAVVSRPVR